MNHDQGAKFPFPFHFVSELVDDVPPYNPARGSGDLISPEQISGTFRGNGWWVTPLQPEFDLITYFPGAASAPRNASGWRLSLAQCAVVESASGVTAVNVLCV